MNIVIDGMRVSLELLNAQRYRNMEVIPVRINRNGHNDYLTLKRGIRAGFVEITECEVSTVGTVLARNKANVPLVLIDGDEIVGAKQNRIMNRSLIVPPLTTMEVSVSCTEQGRWHMTELVIGLTLTIPILQQTFPQEEIRHMTYMKMILANPPFGTPYMTLRGKHLLNLEQALCMIIS